MLTVSFRAEVLIVAIMKPLILVGIYLNMDTWHSSKMSVNFYQTKCRIPEVSILLAQNCLCYKLTETTNLGRHKLIYIIGQINNANKKP
jgi:hypothetical protein